MKPILFNTEMVRALLAGRKRVTRRAVKPQPVCHGPNITFAPHDDSFFLSKEKNWLRCRVCGHDPQYSHEGSNVAHHWTPPYRPGDILYVRETWAAWSRTYGAVPVLCYKADGNAPDGIKWCPSIHMPREAARIFLRVTDVRVERLRDITIESIKKEGIRFRNIRPEGCNCAWAAPGCQNEPCPNREAYESLCWIEPYMEVWNSTIKPADRALYGWVANPWVWVISFERISREKAGPENWGSKR